MTKVIKGFTLGVLVGAMLMVSTYALAGPVNEYLLAKADYPIFVDDKLYESDGLPMLKYQGYTYAPLRAVSELLGVKILWNEELNQVEITRGQLPMGNSAFRNIIVTGEQGIYTVTGEARVFEATFHYEVSDGHFVYQQGFLTTSAGAPEWGTFTLDISVSPEDLPENGTLSLGLYEESANDGSIINELGIALEVFP